MDGHLGLPVGDCSDYINAGDGLPRWVGPVPESGDPGLCVSGESELVSSIHLLLFASLLWIQCG